MRNRLPRSSFANFDPFLRGFVQGMPSADAVRIAKVKALGIDAGKPQTYPLFLKVRSISPQRLLCRYAALD